ncbi:hypothetical protein WN48_05736 [Eufriesea mexicana]|uniref:Uncharacterized protein n=1 Tax=Eufriesea mexicana TaxID=516756 RepID=A0A310SCJ4_9HYME|nr:hypothetical protein WN48_05736 [Eufriesea mexicana]
MGPREICTADTRDDAPLANAGDVIAAGSEVRTMELFRGDAELVRMVIIYRKGISRISMIF